MYGAVTPVSSREEAENHQKTGESDSCLGTMYPYSEVGPAVGVTNHKPSPKIETDKDWKLHAEQTTERTHFGVNAKKVYEMDDISVSPHQ